MRTSTSGRSTRRLTPEHTEPSPRTSVRGRPRQQAVSLILAAALLFVAACDDSDDPQTPGTATPPAAIATLAGASPTAEPARDLGSLIGPRFDLPVADPFDLARRYGLTDGRAPATKPFAGEPAVGDQREFVVVRISGANAAPPVPTTITAVLRSKSAHALFWVDASVPVATADADRAAAFFEATTWPLLTEVFGLPPTPGVDSDPRVVVLQSPLGGVGGYLSSDHLYPREVRPLSNEGEQINMDTSLAIGSPAFNVVLAHELQHLIHEANDAGEDSWVNEGLSETALGIAGGSPSTVGAFTARPYTQLNNWEFGGNNPHYGAAFAFMRYLADRFGGDASLGDVARQSGDGPLGIDQFLEGAGFDGGFAGIFADWIAANVVNAESGPYANPSGAVEVAIDGVIAPGDVVENDARQFGTDYYRVEGLPAGEVEVRFEGEVIVDVLPTSPSSEGAFWWSNRGDEIDTTLTREVDLTESASPVLTFRHWHDIERWYDRGYVSVSTDGGDTWTALPGGTTSDDDPVRLAYGPGYQGTSGDPLAPEWTDEEVSLAAFAGLQVLLRFEYVTDGGTHGEGWAIRDVAIDGEMLPVSEPDWDADGWVQVDGTLPQKWIVRLIGVDVAGAPFVQDVPLDATNAGVLRIDAGSLGDQPVLAVAGATEGTNLRAPYRLELIVR